MNTRSISAPEVTQLLAHWNRGDEAALKQLTPLIYEELRRLAHFQMSGQRPDHTLQTTALVNEAYLRFAGQTKPSWQNRAHFFAVAAHVMRRLLVDHARARGASKRGSGLTVSLDEADVDVAAPLHTQQPDVIALDRALEKLARIDARHLCLCS